ncbi:MAG: tRNA (adenosine(37)-N6)-threonylcarbamoyltransferase complex ATPase subunit type 1 TsaE [Thainema sp.]
MESVLSLFLPDAEHTRQLGVVLGQTLPAGIVLLLEGNLGSGKTTLVQGIGEGLGVTDAIASPTFTLINEYLEGRIPLYHADLYRLEPAETETLYLDMYWDELEVELGIVAIEWAERLVYRPDHYLQIRLLRDETGRQVELIPVGERETEWLINAPLAQQIG